MKEEEVSAIRKARLQALVDKYDTQKALADAADLPASMISSFLRDKKTRNIGERVARKIEKNLGLPSYWLDNPSSNIVEFPQKPGLDAQLLGLCLEKIDQIFPKYGLINLDYFQKSAMAKIIYDRHVTKQMPSEKTVTAEVIQLAEVRRALGGP